MSALKFEKMPVLLDRQLTMQQEVVLKDQLDLFKSAPEWLKAQSVLEVGCGNGVLLEALVQGFPGKNYVGIDIEKDLISKASERLKFSPHVSVYEKDLISLDKLTDGLFDFIICQFVLQHLSSIELFLSSIKRVLKPGGYLCIMDAADEYIEFYPRVFSVNDLITKIDRYSRAEGLLGRAACNRLIESVDMYSFKIVRQGQTLYKTNDAISKHKFSEIFSNLSRIVEERWDLKRNKFLDQELREWIESNESKAQFGVQTLLLQN